MSDYINRSLSRQTESNLFKGRAIMLYGPRQAGKTTLIRNLISERMKKNINNLFQPKSHFWRIIGNQNAEIDYIENSSNKLCAWEIKWNKASKAKIPLCFKNAYPDAETQILTPSNYDEFLL